MGGTYGGNAICCAAALGVLEAFENEQVLDNVNKQEIAVRKRLHALQSTPAGALIREVRGKGLMIGIEFEKFGSNNHGETAYAVVQECIKRDLLVLSCGPYDTVRLIPPLNINDQDLNSGMDKVCEAVTSVYANGGKYCK